MTAKYTDLIREARVEEAHGDYNQKVRNSQFLIQSELKNSYEQQIRAR